MPPRSQESASGVADLDQRLMHDNTRSLASPDIFSNNCKSCSRLGRLPVHCKRKAQIEEAEIRLEFAAKACKEEGRYTASHLSSTGEK